MNIQSYPDREMMMIDLAGKIATDLETALHNNDRATLVVPGGTTPGPIFDDLCAVDLGWDRVNVMLSDERWVPEDSDRSNTKLIHERLLVDKAQAACFVPLYAKSEQPENVIAELECVIRPCLPISVLLLGMGADMHTASIFPGADNLDLALDKNAPILVPMRAPGAPEPRVTLSAHVLNEALSKHIVITGDDKRVALEKALQLSPAEAPIRAVLSGATIHWAK
ncbi:MAG: 6-phosphogluconolactonase [Paracoccaceae bacterium]|nr:6-phosphogluconolactonase [Paracoccaceae bacterium]MDG2259184.1 6-phosphogluconolactonase [Paracoccaceae bacterium]